MSRVGPETNVYVGIARARTCERIAITMIITGPRKLGLTFAIYVIISHLEVFYKFGLRLERLELDVCCFSGHCARRKKGLESEEDRQTATKRVTTNGVSSCGSFK